MKLVWLNTSVAVYLDHVPGIRTATGARSHVRLKLLIWVARFKFDLVSTPLFGLLARSRRLYDDVNLRRVRILKCLNDCVFQSRLTRTVRTGNDDNVVQVRSLELCNRRDVSRVKCPKSHWCLIIVEAEEDAALLTVVTGYIELFFEIIRKNSMLIRIAWPMYVQFCQWLRDRRIGFPKDLLVSPREIS